MKLIFITLGSLVTLIAYQNCSNNMAPLSLDGSSFSASSSVLSASETETQALAVLNNKCVACHSESTNQGGISYIADVNALKYFRVVIPGEPAVSPMYTVLTQNPEHMPMLSQSQMNLIYSWIQIGMSPAAPVAPPNIIPLGGSYASVMRNVIAPKCLSCHNAQAGRPDFSSYTSIMASNTVKPNDPVGSLIMNAIGPTPTKRMPPTGPQLSVLEQKAVSDWIASGALDN